MKNLVLLTIGLILASVSFAQPVQTFQRDIHLPRQKVLEYQLIAIPALADADLLLNDQATGLSATTVTSFLALIDVCRALAVLPAGTTTDVKAGNVVVSGTNIHGKPISESFAFLDNASTATNGIKAFCTVTSIVFPIQDGTGAIYDVGTQDKLGVRQCAASAGSLAWSTFNGAFETTRGVFTADADEVEKNLFDPQGTLDGAKNVEIFFVQNYGCYP